MEKHLHARVKTIPNSKLFRKQFLKYLKTSLREKCPNTEFFWSVFPCIRTKYGDLQSKSPYSVRILTRKIRTRKNSVFGHFSRSAILKVGFW